MVVAVHEDSRLRERLATQEGESRSQHLLVIGVQLELQVPAAEPFRHQLHLALQNGVLVPRQVARVLSTARLNAVQGHHRVEVVRLDIVIRGKVFEIVARAKIRHQQEAVRVLFGENPRDVHTDLGQHGTALDLAGTGQADAGSLAAALQQAIELARTGL